MDLSQVVREAIELQVLEHDPEAAAAALGRGVEEHGPAEVAGALVDAAAVGLRRMVAETDEAYDQAELLSQLALDGAVPEHRLELLSDLLAACAATAGGIRPPIDALATRHGHQDLLFGGWLALITAVRIVAITLERTEAEVAEDVVAAVETF